jgi:hypothetical protein
MDFEQRIDKLTERHEALTQTIELIAHESVQHTRQISQLVSALERLTHIAEIHQRRLDRIEGA